MKKIAQNGSNWLHFSEIIPSQMEVAPVHRSTVLLISHRREVYLRTQKKLKICKRDSQALIVGHRMSKARRPTFGTRLSTPDYPSYIFSISFVFLNSLLFCVISTVQWSGATSICDGIIALGIDLGKLHQSYNSVTALELWNAF